MRPIDKFILHVVHNWDNGLDEAYAPAIMSKLMDKFKEEADDLDIQITDDQLKAYINRFDQLRGASNKVQEKDLFKYSLSKLIQTVTSSKGIEEPQEEYDITPDVVYNENGLIIYNGSKEENCLTFGKGESWCITRGSFGNYRYDSNRKNPTFYLVRDTNLPDSDRKSFFVVVVGNDNTYKASDRTNNDVGGRATEWDRWEPWSFVEQNFPSVRGLRDVFKYIPLSTKEKINQSYKSNSITIKEWMKLPYNVKEQYLVVRKDRGDLFKDITNSEFVEKYLPKYPQIANFIATNAGIINNVILIKHLDKFNNQDVRSIIANMRDLVDLKNLYDDIIPFEVKKLLVKQNKWNVPSTERLYITKDGSTIVNLELSDNIKLKLFTEDDSYPNVKLNKRTSKYLLDYPELDKIPLRNLIKLVQDEIIDQNVINKVLEQAKTNPNSAIVAKDNIILDSNSFASYKISDGKIEQIPFDNEEVQAVFAEQENNEGFQENALNIIKESMRLRSSIPATIDKDGFVSMLRAIPINKRTIGNDEDTYVVITTQSAEHPILLQSVGRGNSSLQLSAWYGDDGNWRKIGGRGDYSEDPEVYRALFTYLRTLGQTYNDNNIIQNLVNVGRRVYRPQGVIKAIVQAGIPMAENSTLKPVIYQDKPYVVNTRSPRESYTVSDSTGKLVKANISPTVANTMLGIAAPAAAAAPTTGRRGRPAGQTNTPRQAAAPAAAGDINVREEMDQIGLDVAFLRLPRAILRKLNVTNATRVDPNGDRGAARRNNMLGNRGRVGRVISIGASKIYIIRLANQQIIASINVQPGNSNYLLFPNASGNAVVPLGSPSDLVQALTQRGLAEHRSYIMNEYLSNYPEQKDEIKDLLKKHLNK